MALMDFIKKQFIDIIEWTEEGDGTLAWRFPMRDLEIQNGAALVVRATQMAVFVNEGQLADVFAPGTHKLQTQTLPVLTYLKNWDKLFASPFKSDVYFLSTRQQIDQKWGTPQPITIRDKDFGAVRLRAFGNYAFRIADARRFHTEVSGTRQTYPVADLQGQLRGLVLQSISSAIAASGLPFLDLAANQNMFAAALTRELAPLFAKLGLLLENLTLQTSRCPRICSSAWTSAQEWKWPETTWAASRSTRPRRRFRRLPGTQARAAAAAVLPATQWGWARALRSARCWRTGCSRICQAARRSPARAARRSRAGKCWERSSGSASSRPRAF